MPLAPPPDPVGGDDGLAGSDPPGDLPQRHLLRPRRDHRQAPRRRGHPTAIFKPTAPPSATPRSTVARASPGWRAISPPNCSPPPAATPAATRPTRRWMRGWRASTRGCPGAIRNACTSSAPAACRSPPPAAWRWPPTRRIFLTAGVFRHDLESFNDTAADDPATPRPAGSAYVRSATDASGEYGGLSPSATRRVLLAAALLLGAPAYGQALHVDFDQVGGDAPVRHESKGDGEDGGIEGAGRSADSARKVCRWSLRLTRRWARRSPLPPGSGRATGRRGRTTTASAPPPRRRWCACRRPTGNCRSSTSGSGRVGWMR